MRIFRASNKITPALEILIKSYLRSPITSLELQWQPLLNGPIVVSQVANLITHKMVHHISRLQRNIVVTAASEVTWISRPLQNL